MKGGFDSRPTRQRQPAPSKSGRKDDMTQVTEAAAGAAGRPRIPVSGGGGEPSPPIRSAGLPGTAHQAPPVDAELEAEAVVVLAEAARIVRRSGWTQHTTVDKDGRVSVEAAIVQAVDTAGKVLPPPLAGLPQVGEPGYGRRVRQLLILARRRGPHQPHGWEAVLWTAMSRFEDWLKVNFRLVRAPRAALHAPSVWWNDQPDMSGGGEVSKALYLASVFGRTLPLGIQHELDSWGEAERRWAAEAEAAGVKWSWILRSARRMASLG